MLRTTSLTAAAFALAAAPTCLAGDEPLTIGDKAPAFDITHWIKGDQIESFEEGKIYLLEFWATWCGPCVASMPHLSELQAKYKDYDVNVLAVSDEPLQTVVEFLFKEYPADGKIQNDRMAFAVTTDPDKSIWKDYFTAAGRTGIPCSFVIGKTGQIEYIGHPMQVDKALEGVVHDNWDRDAFKTTYEEGMKITRIQSKAYEAMREGKFEEAAARFNEALELDPDNVNTIMQIMQIKLVNLKDYEDGYALAAKVVESNWDDANLLNTISWNIATQEGIEKRNLDLALKATVRSNELTDNENAMYLDTLARVYFEKGDLKNALKWQELAVKFLGDDVNEATAATIREALEKYRQGAK